MMHLVERRTLDPLMAPYIVSPRGPTGILYPDFFAVTVFRDQRDQLVFQCPFEVRRLREVTALRYARAHILG